RPRPPSLPPPPEPAGAVPLPSGPPELELAPHVDARLGYEIQLPRGWTRLDTGQGVVAVDGTTWDYEASFQVIVRGFETVDEYLDRYGDWHLGKGRIAEARSAQGAGRPAPLCRRRPTRRAQRRADPGVLRRRSRRRRALGLRPRPPRHVRAVVR